MESGREDDCGAGFKRLCVNQVQTTVYPVTKKEEIGFSLMRETCSGLLTWETWAYRTTCQDQGL